MKITLITLILLLAGTGLFAADALYQQEGSDPSFDEVLASDGVTVGKRFSEGPVPGSRIEVNSALLEKQIGKTGPIAKDIGIHTQASGAIKREDFPKWSRWYQEDGNTQVFRLFKGEQSIRDGKGPDGKPGRVEAFSKSVTAAGGKWREWEGIYTPVKPVDACVFQLMHNGKDSKGRALLWPFHIEGNNKGDLHFHRRRAAAGLPKRVVIATGLTGKSIAIKVRANGTDYEVYKKQPLDKGPWQFVTKGSYHTAEDNKISFRWGMYCGSKKGQSVPSDALLFVTGATIR